MPSSQPLLDIEQDLPSRPARAADRRAPLPGTPEAWNAALLDDLLPPARTLGRRAAPAAPEPALEFESEPAPPVWGLPDTTPAPLRATPLRKTWNAADAKEIQRVAVRLGASPANQDAQRTLDVLWDLAHEHQADPDERLRLYREVAAHVCHVDQPACIRCPLKDHCAYYEHLRQERQKTRGPLRRLWGA